MRAALRWVILIVVLSLAIIRLLNYEQKKRPAPHEQIMNPDRDLSISIPMAATSREQVTSATLQVEVERSLDNFNLQVALGSGQGAVGLLGPSGSGKSMTLRMIAGVTAPDRGRIVLDNRVLYDSAAGVNTSAASRKIGVVFQDYALFPHLTVAENVGFGLRTMPDGERRVRIERQLASMYISELASRYPKEISGGQRQRVAIARCMAMEPVALLLDEPFAALDPHLRRQTEEQLRETLSSFKGAVIFVTHDMEEAFRFCTDLLVLDRGRIIANGPKHELFERPKTIAAARLTGCKNIVPACRLGDHCIEIQAWESKVTTASAVPSNLTHAGFRSHQFIFQESKEGENVYPCWLVDSSEAPHEVTLYLRLHAIERPDQPAHLQADVPKEVWRSLSKRSQPWFIKLDPERVLLLRD